MRTKSIFGVKSITNLIYGLLMIAPFVAILSRVIYTQSNPYAKDSYSQSNTKTNINSLPLEYNKTYYFSNQQTDELYPSNTTIYVSNFTNFLGSGYNSTDIENINNYGIDRLYFNNNGTTNCYVQLSVGTTVKTTINLKNNVVSFNFEYLNSNGSGNSLLFSQIYTIQNTQYGSLDNAFEYSLSQFTQNNDIGVINFFGWFEGMFLNQQNAHNMVYLNFANWYMNYALLVSSSYLLFLALIWFVNYIRRILDKSMNHDFGGF